MTPGKKSLTIDVPQKKMSYDIDNPQDLYVIKEFRAKLEEYKKRPLIQDIRFYGHPVGKEGFVTNELIPSVGFGTHWSVIQYCMDIRCITRSVVDRRVVWTIMSEFMEPGKIGGECRIITFSDFMMKWRGLGSLISREKFNARSVPYKTPDIF